MSKKGLKLFTPVQLGSLKLKHRVVMAPLTRSRSEQPGGIPGDMMMRYYSDRASDGGLIIGEATNISLTSRGWHGAPGLYTDQQVEGWKRVVNAIHAKNGFVFAQLWHTGRASHSDNEDGNTPVSASVDPTYWILGRSHPPGLRSRWLDTAVATSGTRYLRDSGNRQGLPQSGCASQGSGLNCTPPTVISRTSFFKMAVTSGRMPTVVPSRAARDSFWKSWKRWHRFEVVLGLECASRLPAHGTTCTIAIPALCSSTSRSN